MLELDQSRSNAFSVREKKVFCFVFLLYYIFQRIITIREFNFAIHQFNAFFGASFIINSWTCGHVDTACHLRNVTYGHRICVDVLPVSIRFVTSAKVKSISCRGESG